MHKYDYLSRWLSNVGKHWTGIDIHSGVKIEKGFVVDHGIGEDSLLYHGVTLGGTGKEKESITLH